MSIKKIILDGIYRAMSAAQDHRLKMLKQGMGYCDPTAQVAGPIVLNCPQKVFLYENVELWGGSKFIISPHGETGRFVMKKWSGAAEGLTVVTNKHRSKPIIGEYWNELAVCGKYDEEVDIIVEEDVSLSANVTLLPGAHIGRGAIIGAGCVIRRRIPPYAVVIGNPAHIVSFCLTPDEIIRHEELLYPEDERLDRDKLEKNYNSFYRNHSSQIAEYVLHSR